ncbi:hypothetical protein [Shewanella sp. Isolate7]|uniref:hypothetical protein n=1 Tax=Shewanella sp. Isolate7 TaxID=2908528 RepID=UPI001EFE75DB|nr:hypothetical protein [Shewanella sp. Isolate7]MCG9721467.1 hypothetical protein [Shewanella sp. Isolate7]
MMPRALSGMARFWLFDVGSVSFLGTALLALAMMLVLALSGKLDAMPVMLGMIQVSTCAAIAWQLNRLSATEWASLVPGYSQSIQWQALVVGMIATLISLTAALMLPLPGAVEQVILASLAGIAFIYFCRLHIKGFYFSFALFLLLPFLPEITAFLPSLSFWFLPLAAVGLIYLIRCDLQARVWHLEARTVYLNGLEMGWFWLPNLGSNTLMTRLDRWLHPVNFFVGPMLSMMLVLLPALALLLDLVNFFVGIELPVLFIAAQFSAIACSLVHWSRVQRWRAVETLYILPGFDGKCGLVEAFASAQYRLLGYLTLTMALLATLTLALRPEFTLILWSHLVLSTFCVCAILLGLGCAARNAMHISLSLFVVICHAIWLSTALVAMRDGKDLSTWLALDIGLVAFSLFTLWWGKRKLWRDALA